MYQRYPAGRYYRALNFNDMKEGNFILYVKFIILIVALIAATATLNTGLGSSERHGGAIGLGILAAGCFIAFAMIDSNDVREANKD
jgi:hypothetical protein